MRLSTAIRHFGEQLQAEGKARRTREAYLRDVHLLQRWFKKDVSISVIQPRTLTQFLTSELFTHCSQDRPKAPISLNRSKTAIRSFCQFLVEAGYLKENPARLVRLGRAPKKTPRAMSSREVERLLSTLSQQKGSIASRDHMMFALLVGTGIRLGSLVDINVGDVNVAEGMIRITGKGNVEQHVFLNRTLSRMLRRHISERSNSDNPLFVSVQGRRIGARQVQLRFANWLDMAGIKRGHTVHSLRHTFASRLYERTGDIRLVQRALGHRTLATTEIYATATDFQLRRALG